MSSVKKIMQLALLLVSSALFAQDNNQQDFKLGDVVPNYRFTDLRNFPKKEISISDFRGKWLVIDFWGMNCGSCIGSFAKMDRIAEKYNGRLQLIMLGEHKGSVNELASEKSTKALFEKYKKIFNLKFTVAFDSVLYHKWGVSGLPTIFYIDPEGILRGRSNDISEEIVQAMLDGKQLDMKFAYPRWSTTAQRKLEEQAVIDIHNLSLPLDTSILFRSTITKHRPGLSMQLSSHLLNDNFIMKKGGRAYWFKSNISLKSLYMYSYFGGSVLSEELRDSISPIPIFEFRDTSLLRSILPTANGMVGNYDYSIVLPEKRGKASNIRTQLKRDLDSYFGFHTSWEMRKTNVWKLIVVNPTKATKLRAADQLAKTKQLYLTSLKEYGEIAYESISPRSLLNRAHGALQRYLQKLTGQPKNYELILVDDTGLDFKLDITINAAAHDFLGIKKCLNSHGLDIVEGEKMMSTLVIRDFDPGIKLGR